MQHTFVAAGSPDWAAALQTFKHDVYHFSGYAELCAEVEGGEARAFVARDGAHGLFIPFIVRHVPSPLSDGSAVHDVTVPYGYPAPLFSPGGDAGLTPRSFVRHALQTFFDGLHSDRVVSAFFRLHPLLDDGIEVLGEFGAVMDTGNTVAIDLSLAEDVLWNQMRSNHRRDIVKARARGEGAGRDVAWADLASFVDAYRQTMMRVGANPYYLFSDSYFDRLRGAWGEHVHLWTVKAGPEFVGGALFTECHGIVQYHLGGAPDRFLPSNPVKLLFHEAAKWYKQRGNRWLHLGGGVGAAGDSLMHFKLGFSNRTFPFRTWRVVVDAQAYGDLTGSTSDSATRMAAAPSFFPAYRHLVREEQIQ